MPFETTITPAKIAVALGQVAPEDGSLTFQRWEMWIGDALMLIQDRADELDVTDVPQAKLDYVVREAVVAHANHPDNATQVTIAVDDGSSTRSYRSGEGRVTIIDKWWAMLGLTDPDGAFSVDMAPVSTVHQPWCSLFFGALYCSCGTDIAGHPIYEGEW
jgi:hypothetical protein